MILGIFHLDDQKQSVCIVVSEQHSLLLQEKKNEIELLSWREVRSPFLVVYFCPAILIFRKALVHTCHVG